jgi:hypothetical protein
MQNFKFRAYNVRTKKWLPYFSLIPTSPNWSACPIESPPNDEDRPINAIMGDPIGDYSLTDWADGDILSGYYKTMQYIQLKDKNGREIYEGDIVHILGFNNVEGTVEYEAENARYVVVSFRTGTHHILLPPAHMEVIGNIYDNPELRDASL